LRDKAEELRRRVEERVRFLSDLGAGFVFRPETKGNDLVERPGHVDEPDLAQGAAKLSVPDKTSVLRPLEDAVRRCTLCRLSEGRRQAVPGEGSYDTPLMFVGEGPGADEDLQGRPFVGRAGQLLTKIIAAMKFTRDEVYITNIVKCRPPENRTPFRDEVEACQPYLLTQIRTIGPRVIVALGKTATSFFVPSPAGMSDLRGKFVDFGGIPVMPTFHPSYVMRNEGDTRVKRLVWQDMQQVMEFLGKK
jgi:uracil-DNA glycosylase family 4